MNFLLKKDENWETFFLKTILIFGIIIMLFTPIMQVQDEDTHTMRSINMSYFNFDYKRGFNIFESVYTFINQYTEENGIYIFETDKDYRISHELYWKCMSLPLNEEEKVFFLDGTETGLRTSLYGNLAYFPQGIGILVGRIFELPIYYTLQLGRFIKLLTYTLLCFWAIKLIPIKKSVLTFLSLMPMPVFFAASLSPDGILVSSCYLFIAYILYCKDRDKKINKKDILLLTLLFAFIFSIKIIYSIILIWIIIILDVKEIFKNHKKQCILASVIMFFSLLLGTVILYHLSPTVKLCIDNLPLVLYLYLKTYISKFTYYLDLGIANFGTGYEPLNRTYIYCIAIYTIIMFLQKENNIEKEEKIRILIDVKTKVVAGILFFGISFLIFIAGIQMTHLENLNVNTDIVGIQGRYFIAFIPLLSLTLTNGYFDFKWLIHPYVIKLFSIIMLLVSAIWILHRYW